MRENKLTLQIKADRISPTKMKRGVGGKQMVENLAGESSSSGANNRDKIAK